VPRQHGRFSISHQVTLKPISTLKHDLTHSVFEGVREIWVVEFVRYHKYCRMIMAEAKLKMAGHALSIMAVLALVFQCSGCAPASHSVTLSWQPPTAGEVPVRGYNIYRSDKPGGPYSQIASGIRVPAYKDTHVNSHATYYYVVTTVDATGAESGHSAEISATVP
jgi:hypothetical protein